MVPSGHDLCLLYSKHPTGDVRGVTCLRTDDTLSAGTKGFISLEEKESKVFQSKQAEFLAPENHLKFNGALLSRKGSDILISQPNHISKLALIADPVLKDEYVTQRARGSYIAGVCRPELSFGFSFAAQSTDPQAKEGKFLNNELRIAFLAPI